MVRSIRSSSLVATRECGRMVRTARRAGMAVILGLALLAAPPSSTSHASSIRTSPHLAMTCDGPRNFQGPWSVPGGTYQATVNFCDSGEYYQTLLQYNGFGQWQVCEYRSQPITLDCNPGINSYGSGPTTTYSPGTIYVQSQMYSEVIIP